MANYGYGYFIRTHFPDLLFACCVWSLVRAGEADGGWLLQIVAVEDMVKERNGNLYCSNRSRLCNWISIQISY